MPNSFNKGYARIEISEKDAKYSTFDGNDDWDVCIVAPLIGSDEEDNKTKEKINKYESRIENVGLDCKKYLSVQNDEIYLLIRSNEPQLKLMAEMFDIDLECKGEVIQKMSQQMEDLFQIPNFSIPSKQTLKSEDIDVSNLMDNYEHIWLPYKSEPVYKDLYVQHNREGSIEKTLFSSSLRIKLIMMLLRRSLSDGGVSLDDDKLDNFGWNMYPLHCHKERLTLSKIWLNSWKVMIGWKQPLDSTRNSEFNMKDYLGEHVTLYFSFLGTHCRWLFVLGLIGAFVQGNIYVDGNPESILVAGFALIVSVWAAVFTECWKRNEAYLSLKWGMSEFEAKEEVRMRFKKSNPVKSHSVVTGHLDYKVPNVKDRARRLLFSYICILIAIICIVIINLLLYHFKLRWKDSQYPLIAENYSTIFSIALSITISVVNSTYMKMAEFLTELENHRTETQYNDSKITKLLACLLISSFGSLTYAAFFQENLEGSCDNVRCMPYLTKLVFTILIERLLFTMLFDNIIPRIKAHMRFKKETAGVDAELFSAPEFEFILDPFDNNAEIISRYMDQVLMFGYMVLFVTAFPMAPFIGYVSNIFQIHQYGQALLFRKRRNIPIGAQDIGSFQYCFEFIATLAMVSNSGLVFFTMRDSFFGLDFPGKIILWLFFGTIGMIKLFINVIQFIIPDEAETVLIQLKRTEFIKKRLIELSHEDEYIDEDNNMEMQYQKKRNSKKDMILNEEAPLTTAQVQRMI